MFLCIIRKKKINHNASIQSWLHVEIFHDAFHDFDRFPVIVKSRKFAASVKKIFWHPGQSYSGVDKNKLRVSWIYKKAYLTRVFVLDGFRGGEGAPFFSDFLEIF